MSADPGSIVALVAHARHVPAMDRERFAADVRQALAGRGLVLETCHRVEGYAADPTDEARIAGLSLPVGARKLEGQAAIRHAVSVAVGRDSVVVGEDQVLHQIREAVDAARSFGGFDPVLERLFAVALRAGRRARSWHQGPRPSLATVALTAIEERSGPLRDRPFLVVGGGRMGRLAARAAAAAGAAVTVTSRSSARADELAHDVGGQVAPFDPGPVVEGFAGIIIALSGPWPIGAASARALARGSVDVVDLSVPPALTDELKSRLGRRLITADDIARMGSVADHHDEQGARRLEALIDQTTGEFVAWLDGRQRRATAADLTLRAELAREAELAALWRRLPELDPETRGAIDAMSRHLAERLLREPLERLGHDADGAGERAVREAFAL